VSVDTATKSGRGKYDPVGKRRALIDAAIDLFSRDGFDATSVRSIARHAGLTSGSFYHQFSNKQALLFEIHDRLIDAHLERAHAVAASELPAPEKLRVFMRDVLVEGSRDFQRELRIFYEERRRLSPKQMAAIVEKRDQFEQCLVGVITECAESGDCRDLGNPRILAFGIVGMCAWTYHWVDPTRGDVKAIGELYADLVLDGFRNHTPDS
jgi:TetR/AcrR family transcriptional regulator, cholesterol catabolism regulator